MASEPEERPEFQSGFAAGSWSPERRERQSEMVTRLAAEGRFGGPETGRRGGIASGIARRKRRAPVQEVFAEKARNLATELANELTRMALHGSSEKTKLDAMRLLMDSTDWVEKLLRSDEKELSKLSGKELDEALHAAIADTLGVSVDDLQTQITDAEVVGDNDEEEEVDGEIDPDDGQY